MRAAIRTTLAVLMAAVIVPVFAQEKLPSGDAIVDKYIEVTGGKAAYERVHSEVMTGTMTFTAMGIKGTLNVYHAEPALMLTEINIEGIGKIQEGSDGKVAWSLSSIQGPRLKEGDEKTEALRTAAMHVESKWRDFYTKAETAGIETIDAKPCYKVVLTPKEGSGETRFYDKETGLLVKATKKLTTPMGEIDAESFTSDYRKEGEILVPHKMLQKAAGQEFVMIIDSLQHNVTIAKEKFDLPDEIKALVAKGK